MATRIKDWMIPYTWWQWIEITNNHVINVLLRKFNNLIQVNGDRELYVDLQLPEWIQPDDDFPVGVTTGKILAEDWWQQSWIILNWKTTSWDYVRFIHANDWKLYYDPWTWTWIEIWAWWGWVQINVATATSLWLIKLGTDTKQTIVAELPSTEAWRTYPVQLNANNQAVVNIPWENTTYTAWANIVIDQNNVISTTIPPVLVYKGNVTDISDLPASWTVWDTYFVEWEDAMYSWDWNQWNYVWGTGIDISNLFNKTIDTSDDITQWTTNLFVTQQEKNTWNNKQDRISAWDGIDITNNVISNTLPFDPDNAGSLGQFLKKTNNGYAWADIPWWWGGWGSSYTAGDGINITNNVISNTAMFNPTNQWNVGQVLKKSGTNSYYWANESWWGSGNFNPENPWTIGQVLTKTATWYDWETISGDSNVKWFSINFLDYTQEELEEIVAWVNQSEDHIAILKNEATSDAYVYSSVRSTSWKLIYEFQWIIYYTDNNNDGNWDYTTLYNHMLTITLENHVYTLTSVEFNAIANFLKVSNSGYVNAYMPTAPYQPTTKAYVDSRNWTWTLSQYNALTTIDPDVVYNITSLN